MFEHFIKFYNINTIDSKLVNSLLTIEEVLEHYKIDLEQTTDFYTFKIVLKYDDKITLYFYSFKDDGMHGKIQLARILINNEYLNY